jgi:hypothetical protein
MRFSQKYKSINAKYIPISREIPSVLDFNIDIDIDVSVMPKELL